MTAPSLRVGIDLVEVSRIAESLDKFGERFLRRVFTAHEVAYASEAPALMCGRLAARFAAKEAAIKALDLADQALSWHDIEVRRSPSGDCGLALRGAAAAALGAGDVAVSLSHEGDFATAVVIARVREAPAS